MTPEIKRAIGDLVDYLYHDELMDYLEQSGINENCGDHPAPNEEMGLQGARKSRTHIFCSVVEVMDYLQKGGE